MSPIVTIIPARGGSKGIPSKNIHPIAGVPLISYSIQHSLGSPSIDHTYVSTDSEAIATIAEAEGARIIKRPPAISEDTATSESALIHALEKIETEIGAVSTVVFLQCTSPIRLPDDIENAIRQFENENADSLLSVCPVRDFFIWKKINDSAQSTNYDFKNRKRRQNIEKTYLENGSIYIFKPQLLKETNNRLGGKISFYEMPFWRSWQIDNKVDIPVVEHWLNFRDTLE